MSDFQPQNILVPIDFSAASEKALRYARAFAQEFNAKVHLVHIAEPVPIFAGIDAVAIPVSDPKQLAILERKLADLAKELPAESAGSTIVRSAWGIDEIISVAKELRTDLIIISSHGHSAIQRVLFGSTAEGVVRKAPCDVLVLRPEEREFINMAETAERRFNFALKSILVPIDFSDMSRQALGYAVTFARRFQAKLICLHVLEVLPYAGPEPIADVELIGKALFASTERTLEAFLKEQTMQLARENVLTFGSPSREIIQIAEDRKTDLIIMGTHGKASPGRFLLGSTAERVVRHAHSPILVVRERK